MDGVYNLETLARLVSKWKKSKPGQGLDHTFKHKRRRYELHLAAGKGLYNPWVELWCDGQYIMEQEIEKTIADGILRKWSGTEDMETFCEKASKAIR